ncbi:hypothetical protein [Streptomyces radiopugnans]|uniref:Uncharacterized protein n=1 Tax=Streptomyces radiopugnans TaxID=403935 RepID=A0A1H9HL64_9ACTN|nr:hypothetical protein [Streptomyces radiopugnans]SEQ62986.1 hypothetical protein SAMN05216481_111128 [Streptomyces radiopugnans]
MTTTITTITTEPIGREVLASCLLGSRPSGTRAFGAAAARPASLAVLSIRERVSERPTQAPAVVAAAQADAYAFTGAANGAGNGQKQAKHHTMWAFRGLEPWRDPA